MPFQTAKDLPETVKEHLPEHARDIYLEAFNSAWDHYDQPDERHGDDTREETAHKVAWAAVKKVYEKNEEGRWVKSAT